MDPWGEYEPALAREYETIEHTRHESVVSGIVPKYCRRKRALPYSMSFKVVDREKFQKKKVLHEIYGIGEASAFSEDISRVMKTVFRRYRREMKDQAVEGAEKELKPILLGKYGVEITDFRGFGVVKIKWEEED